MEEEYLTTLLSLTNYVYKFSRYIYFYTDIGIGIHPKVRKLELVFGSLLTR